MEVRTPAEVHQSDGVDDFVLRQDPSRSERHQEAGGEKKGGASEERTGTGHAVFSER